MSARLAVEDLRVSLDGRRVLDGVSLSVAAGECVGLIGPNGAGKSTLLRAAAGLIPIDEGARQLGGDAVDDLSAMARARRRAYLPQARPVFWSLPVRNIVALGRFAYGGAGARLSPEDSRAIEAAMAEAGVAALAERPAASLSGGELARAHLARTLAAEAPVILADEPTAALDPHHQIAVMAALRRRADRGAAVIAAVHDLSLAAAHCTRIVALDNGAKAADGAPETVLTPDVFEKVFAVRGAVAWTDGAPVLSLTALNNPSVSG